MIFFSNFLGLMIKAEVTSAESRSSFIFSVVLIMVHILFFFSIWGNAYVSVKFMFSRDNVQVRLIKETMFKQPVAGTCTKSMSLVRHTFLRPSSCPYQGTKP